MTKEEKKLSENKLSFEQAYARLEQILEKMNSGESSLEESLALFEEADQLIGKCSAQLEQAEKRIETLIRQRDGTLKTEELSQE